MWQNYSPIVMGLPKLCNRLGFAVYFCIIRYTRIVRLKQEKHTVLTGPCNTLGSSGCPVHVAHLASALPHTLFPVELHSAHQIHCTRTAYTYHHNQAASWLAVQGKPWCRRSVRFIKLISTCSPSHAASPCVHWRLPRTCPWRLRHWHAPCRTPVTSRGTAHQCAMYCVLRT